MAGVFVLFPNHGATTSIAFSYDPSERARELIGTAECYLTPGLVPMAPGHEEKTRDYLGRAAAARRGGARRSSQPQPGPKGVRRAIAHGVWAVLYTSLWKPSSDI